MDNEKPVEKPAHQSLMDKIDALYQTHIHAHILQMETESIKRVQAFIALVKAEIGKL